MSEQNDIASYAGDKEEVGYPYDLLVVLGATMEWNDIRAKWTFPAVIEHYAGKLVMGQLRAFATREIQDVAPLILVTGGSDIHPHTGQRHSRAEELARVITNIYHVPKEKVISIGQPISGHTLGNVENVVAYIDAHSESIRTHKLAILSPQFQQQRAAAMFDQNPYFKKHGIELEWIVVEDVILAKYPLFGRWIDKIYDSPEAKINRQLEEKGLRDLCEGTYKAIDF